MDCTHDNELPAQKRDARDTLPNAALVSRPDDKTLRIRGGRDVLPSLMDKIDEFGVYLVVSYSTLSSAGLVHGLYP
jgi:glycogen debranching enzyme